MAPMQICVIECGELVGSVLMILIRDFNIYKGDQDKLKETP